MTMEVIKGIFIPFLGTTLGAVFILFAKKELYTRIQGPINGFVSGIMLAASVWSLLLPAIEQSEGMGVFSFVPAAVGLLLGMIFIMGLDQLSASFLQTKKEQTMSEKSRMVLLAVTLHNIPEGMAVGAVYAGLLSGNTQITLAGALMLSLGIGLQNIPEGTIISMPLCAGGVKKSKAAVYGILSGIVEPISALLTIWATEIIVPILPYLLSFAAGAMIYVVACELIPEMMEGRQKRTSTLLLGIGFCIMMTLDVAFG